MHISASGAATAALRRSIMLTALLLVAVLGATPAHADNRRLNESVIANVYTVQRQAGCSTEITRNLALQLAAQWHARDAVAHRDVYGEIGSDGSTSQSRADRAGYHGTAQQTVAINPALAISGIELINQWYHNPVSLGIMRNCANTEIGVWSENSFDRTVVVSVFGQPN